MSKPPGTPPAFDAYAEAYDAALARGISVSGEDKAFFASGRVRWLARRLAALGKVPATVLDFGCGTGTAAPFLTTQFPGAEVLGVDISGASLEHARKLHGSQRVRFQLATEYRPAGEIDLAFCNGVFHHIPVLERAGAVTLVRRALRPGGLFAFWENNPSNPGTRYVMSRIPFDRDAIMLSPSAARQLLREEGFEILWTDSCFYFPSWLHWLRWLEPALVALPLGAQYLVLGRKAAPGSDG